MKNSNGFVSLLTTIMISLLLLIITLSMVSLETLQLRKSEDAEQSVRAYYAAEAGVEDAVTKVLSGTSVAGCSSNLAFDAAGAAGWTCQQVNITGLPSGNLDHFCPGSATDVCEDAKTVDPGVGAPYQSVKVEWDQSSGTAAFYQPNLPGGKLPPEGGWGVKAAPIELSITQYPSGNFASSDARLLQQNALIVPATGGQSTITMGSLANQGMLHGHCVPGNGLAYNCSAVINGFQGADGYIFRLRARYTATAFQMTFYKNANAGGGTVDVPGGMATIDVTAKAGQTYRRVVSKLPLGGGANAGLNYVMYSDGDINKNFCVLSNGTLPCP